MITDEMVAAAERERMVVERDAEIERLSADGVIDAMMKDER